MIRVLVCGSRICADRELVQRAMAPYVGRVVGRYNTSAHTIITGGATGVDSLAHQIATAAKMNTLIFRADWKTHGKAAGPIRNQRMIDEGKPDLVLAFPGGRGTADMIRRAEAAGIPVQRVE